MRVSNLYPMVCLALWSVLGCRPTTEAPPMNAARAPLPERATGQPQEDTPGPPPSISDAATFADATLGDEAEPDHAPPKPTSPEALVAAMRDALEAVLRCPRAPGGLRVANPSECLRPLQTARDALKRTRVGPGEHSDTEAHLRKELARLLVQAASREEPTLVLYALKHHEGDFGDSPEARQILDKRMNDRRMDIAVAAATARLHHLSREDTAGLAMAHSYLKSKRPDRLRVVSCAAIGARTFAGDRTHIDLLLSLAADKAESTLVRGCAAQRLGNIVTPSDLNSVANLLNDPVVQSDTVRALVKGMATKKAFSAVMRWLGKQVKRPALLQASTLSRLLPPEDKMQDFPLNKLAKPLRALIINAKTPVATRLAAVETFSAVSVGQERRCLANGASKTCPTSTSKLDQLLKKIERSTLPNDLRVRSRLSRAKAAIAASESKAKPAED